MRKILALLSVIALMGSLCACAPKECESCGREGKTKKYTYEGESAYLCEDCGAIVNFAKSLN